MTAQVTGGRRPARTAVVAGGIAAACCVAGALARPGAFFPAYLAALLFWTGLAVGCLAVVLLNHLVGGRWGEPIRPIVRAGASTLPLLAVLFVPVLFGLDRLFPWARPDQVAADELLRHRRLYLNAPFFGVRMLIYFAVWIGLTRFVALRDPTAAVRRRSAWGLILLLFTITFAAIDWIMSLQPHWYSTMLGLLVLTGFVLSGFAFAVLVAGRREGPKDPKRFGDLGNLLLAFVMLWAYLAFSQYLIVWSGDLPEETSWYLERAGGGWKWVAGLLAIVHFAVPFALLLSRRIKRTPRLLAMLAAGLLIARWIDVYWYVAPSFAPVRFEWLAVAAPVAVGGFWVAWYLRHLRKANA